MSKIKYMILGFILFTAACKTDRYPETLISDETYWKSENDLKLAANYLYAFLPGLPITDDNMSDDGYATLPNTISDGSRTVPGTDDNFNTNYTLIRTACNIIEKAPRAAANNVDLSIVNRYVGEAKFFRAWAYFNLIERFGDVPLVMRALPSDAAELHEAKTNREIIIDSIYADLDFAANALPTASKLISSGDYGRISKTAALGFKSRVALFEGTWDKFHGTGNANKHLNIAVIASLAVINSGSHSLFTGGYFNLFQYAGEGPTNPENILVRQYGADINNNISSTNTPGQMINGATNPTKALVDAYLMIDGMPINKSPLYTKPDSSLGVFNKRDARLGASVMKKGDPYGITSNFVVSELAFQPTGFCFRKFVIVEDERNSTSFIDRPIMRYAEVLLNYAEALFELNGTISNSDLDMTINKLRDRASVTHLSNEFAIAHGLDLRTEIRRERRIELSAEGFRYWDLLRWKTAETELVKSILGNYYFKKEYDAAGSVYSPNLTADNYLLVEDAANRNFVPQKDYLWPFPVTELALNSNLAQNPGWQ